MSVWSLPEARCHFPLRSGLSCNSKEPQALMPHGCAVLGTLWTGSADRRVARSGMRGTWGTLRQGRLTLFCVTQKGQETEGLQSDTTTLKWDWDLRSWRKKCKVSVRKRGRERPDSLQTVRTCDLGYTEKWPLWFEKEKYFWGGAYYVLGTHYVSDCCIKLVSGRARNWTWIFCSLRSILFISPSLERQSIGGCISWW